MVIADRQSGRVIRKVSVRGLRANFPMVLNEEAQRISIVFRDPPVLRTLTLDGTLLTDVDVCGDADDLFVDSVRHRTYVICGEGVVDVLNGNGLRIERIATAVGARTGLFVPELDRLFVAVPARKGTKAEIRVFEPRTVDQIDAGSEGRGGHKEDGK